LINEHHINITCLVSAEHSSLLSIKTNFFDNKTVNRADLVHGLMQSTQSARKLSCCMAGSNFMGQFTEILPLEGLLTFQQDVFY